MRLPAWFNRANGLAAAVGGLLPLAFAPVGAWWLAPCLVAALFALWDGQPPRTAAIRGMCFGLAAFTAGTYWTYISVHGFAGTPAGLAILLCGALVVACAAHVAAAGWLAARCRGPMVWRWVCCWPAAFVLTEWVRSWLATGFPWLSLGYAQVDGPLRAWGPVAGVYGLSLLVLAAGGCLLCLWRGPGRTRAVGAAGLVALVAGSWLLQGREWTRPAGPPVSVALVQGAIPQDRKWLRQQRLPTMALYRDLTFGEPDVDLAVWPEVAIPAMAHEVRDYLDALAAAAAARDMRLLLGILTEDVPTGQFYNSLLVVGAGDGVYNKRHLVPFGEFFPVPGFVRNWMRLMNLPYRDAARGRRDQPALVAGSLQLAPSICYEDAFGAEQLDFLPQAGLLVNVSNDAWFGDSIAAHQHLQIARMRAVETGRPMLRATNTGITALIAHDGSVLGRLPQFQPGVLRGEIRPRSGSTPFARTGNAPVIVIALGLLAAGLWLPVRGVHPR